jgi:hypothetical protein
MGIGRRTLAAAAGATLTLAASAPAWASAPDKPACVDAATRGQVYRDDQKFKSATEAFTLCSQPSCPPVVRKSCVEWLAQIQSRMPTLVVKVTPTPDFDVRLRIDDAAAKLDAPVQLDPGKHTVRLEADAHSPVVQAITLREGESRALELAPPKPVPTAERPERPIPLTFWVLGGVAVAGAASFAIFGLSAKSETDRLELQCAPACAPEDKSSAFRLAVIADVSLAVGALAALAASYVFFTRPWVYPSKANTAGAVWFRPRSGGAGDVPVWFRPRSGGAGDVPSVRWTPTGVGGSF